MTRELVRQTRRDLASWQRAALGLLALSVGVNTALCAAIVHRERQIEDLETRYHAVRAIEADAVAAYGALASRVDADREARQAQAEAYEAIGAMSTSASAPSPTTAARPTNTYVGTATA